MRYVEVSHFVKFIISRDSLKGCHRAMLYGARAGNNNWQFV
jgi:hypothetical protein